MIETLDNLRLAIKTAGMRKIALFQAFCPCGAGAIAGLVLSSVLYLNKNAWNAEDCVVSGNWARDL